MVRKIDVGTKTIQTYEKTAQMYSKLHINDREIIPFAEFFSRTFGWTKNVRYW